MTKTFAQVRSEVAAASAASSNPADALLPCSFCQAPTPLRVLSECGARCSACYGQFLRQGYSGASREAPSARQAEWVRRLASRTRERARSVPNAFSQLAAEIKRKS